MRVGEGHELLVEVDVDEPRAQVLVRPQLAGVLQLLERQQRERELEAARAGQRLDARVQVRLALHDLVLAHRRVDRAHEGARQRAAHARHRDPAAPLAAAGPRLAIAHGLAVRALRVGRGRDRGALRPLARQLLERRMEAELLVDRREAAPLVLLIRRLRPPRQPPHCVKHSYLSHAMLDAVHL